VEWAVTVVGLPRAQGFATPSTALRNSHSRYFPSTVATLANPNLPTYLSLSPPAQSALRPSAVHLGFPFGASSCALSRRGNPIAALLYSILLHLRQTTFNSRGPRPS